MFHMLSCFTLKDGVQIDEFKEALDAFTEHMRDQTLIASIGPIGRRRRDTPMDTDDARDHALFFVTHFDDRSQCDSAYSYILAADQQVAKIHYAVMGKVKSDAVFICWEDA
ncbi:MAG: DUF6614 family protein [Pseudomonadota bacterium]